MDNIGLSKATNEKRPTLLPASDDLQNEPEKKQREGVTPTQLF
jgi:hypothetical protein